jgi:hypothetical protein
MNNFAVSEVKFFRESRGVVTRGFNIERPKEGEFVSGDLFIVAGWIVGKTSRAVEVNVLLSGKTISVALVNISRPDVEKEHPVEDAKISGFRVDIPVVSLQDASELNLIATLEDGTQVPLANICFEKQVDGSTAEEEGKEVGGVSDQGMVPAKNELPVGKSVQPKSRKKTSARRKKSR